MPTTSPTLTVGRVNRYIRQHCFRPSVEDRVGVEQEWLTFAVDDRCRRLTPSEVLTAAAPATLTAGSRVTVEPGGQVEISSPPLAPWPAAVAALEVDTASLRVALRGVGLRAIGLGLDPHRPPERSLHEPRYDAMERFFGGPRSAGGTMMSCSAAIQVNLDAGSPGIVAARWRLANDLGPVLAACFANSPIFADRALAHRSGRLVVWESIDQSRCAPVPVDDEPDVAWTRYALDAQVMLVRDRAGGCEAVLEPLRFEDWIRDGHPLGYPTEDDLAYHLTTLFPPVRPRAWLELRMLDSLPAALAPVAVAFTAVLLLDPRASRLAAEACAPVATMWRVAARDALTDPSLAAAARACADAAMDGLRRAQVSASLLAACERFIAEYIALGRCPADDVLDRWSPVDGALVLEEAACR